MIHSASKIVAVVLRAVRRAPSCAAGAEPGPRAGRSSHWPTPSRAPAVILAALAGCLVCGAPAAAAQPTSIRGFLESRSQWESFAQGKVRLTLEGRYRSMAPAALRFTNCDLPFEAEEGETFPRLPGQSRRIEVSGHLEKDRRGLVFIVKTIQQLPSDLATFGKKRAVLPPDDERAWYDLGDWAHARGAFYKDEELLQKAREVYFRGVNIERRELSADDADGLLELAEKAGRYELPESLRRELVHEAYQRLWKKSRAAGRPEPAALLETMSQDLEGSKIPLDPPQPALRERYWDNPLQVYNRSGLDERPALHRIFYSTVLLEKITDKAQQDGSNGFEIARRIDALVPEQHALAETFRKRELEFRMTNLNTATRREAVELAERFRRRSQPDQGRLALESWLSAKTESLRREGPAGLVRAAEAYISLIDDKQSAAKLLVEAYELSDGSKEVAVKLRELGYQQRDGGWLSPDEFKQLPEDPARKAMREGRIIVGMTTEQVRKTLGVPKSSSRVATAGRIDEVWTYGEGGGSRLAVHFLRSTETDAAATVVRVSQFEARQ